MPTSSVSRITGYLFAAVLAVSPFFAHGQSEEAAPIKKQLPADERAFRVARANMDPDQRLAAMRDFLKSYPKSSRASRAEYDILKVLIDEYPRRSTELRTEIELQVHHAEGSQSRASTEEEIASLLAESGSAGIELPQAEALAKDAVAHLSEEAYDKETRAMYAKYKVPPPPADELHKQFAGNRAEALAVLADVYLQEQKAAAASPLIAEAYGLDPRSDTVNAQRGRLALLNHDETLALQSFERAQLLGTLEARDRGTMVQLYRKSHGASEAGFSAELDAQYAQLFPATFTPGKPKDVAQGRTVLLELFTGSACPPCVGADLAVDGLLQAYPRIEFVALSFDQHIPEPDPLTNPDSAARADFYGVDHTPNLVVDGELQPLYGGDRDASKSLYDKLATLVDTEAARHDGVSLTASASTDGGHITTHALVTLPAEAEISKELAAPSPTTAASDDKTATPTPASVEHPTPSLIVNFALVEDDIRYSGENGVRFHRMVVRSLAKPASSGFPISAGATATFDAVFEPAAISLALTKYLDGYEEKNEKFGKIKFITKDMTMRPEELLVAVWVQDAASHRILQTTIVPVSGTHEGTN